MGLIHNQPIRISSGPNEGLYRVILDEPRINKTVLVKLNESNSAIRGRGGRPMLASTKSSRKKKPQPLIGALIWALPLASGEDCFSSLCNDVPSAAVAYRHRPRVSLDFPYGHAAGPLWRDGGNSAPRSWPVRHIPQQRKFVKSALTARQIS